ncbi:MAG TPA: long-chain fatty acid--CoA ligase [Woeseiaceae bacterium]
MKSDLATWLETWAGCGPARTALHFEGTDISYKALRDRVEFLSRRLAGAAAPGERIGYLGSNHPDVIALTFACARSATILVPLNYRLAAPEIRTILEDCCPRLLLVAPEFAEMGDAIAAGTDTEVIHLRSSDGPWFTLSVPTVRASPAAAPSAQTLDRPLLLMYTSGTTGAPKGAVLTQEGMLWNARNAVDGHEMTASDNVLTNLPLFHVGGLAIQTLPALYLGATVTLQSRFDPELALREIAARRVTITLAVATMMRAMLEHPAWKTTDLSSLRVVMTGASIIPDSLLQAYLERGVIASQVFGATEMGPIGACLRPSDAVRKLGSVGSPAVHRELRIVDSDGVALAPGLEGEIIVRGPGLMAGYWNNPAATASALQEGWFHTGDMGRCDEEGFYYIVGRKKEMINSGGEKIYPAEIENVLSDCPDIVEAAVVGRPDPRWGEVPVAFVVASPGCEISADELRSRLNGSIARYKLPRDYIFLDALPRNALGKIVRSELRDRARRGAKLTSR